MARQVARCKEREGASAIVRHMHRLVVYGPSDLDIASAMSVYGYDAVKWAEGQSMLAELVSSDAYPETSLALAREWCNEAATAARRALATRPQLLGKLGVTGLGTE